MKLMPDSTDSNGHCVISAPLLGRLRSVRESGRPVVLIVTGGIGAGKSMLCKELATDDRVAHLDADHQGHLLLDGDNDLTRDLITSYGSAVIDHHGCIIRERLGDIVFKDAKALQKLEAKLHPLILKSLTEQVESLKTDDRLVMVLAEIPLLVEVGTPQWSDLVLTVETTYETRISRLLKRGLSRQQVENRIARQTSDTRRRDIADIVINNNGSLESLKASARDILKQISSLDGGEE